MPIKSLHKLTELTSRRDDQPQTSRGGNAYTRSQTLLLHAHTVPNATHSLDGKHVDAKHFAALAVVAAVVATVVQQSSDLQ